MRRMTHSGHSAVCRSHPIQQALRDRHGWHFTYPCRAEKDRIRFYPRSTRLTSGVEDWVRMMDRLNAWKRWPLWLTKPTHGRTALASYRERRLRDSIQIVFHSDHGIEVDIDSWNPAMGAGPALAHLAVDVIWKNLKKIKLS